MSKYKKEVERLQRELQAKATEIERLNRSLKEAAASEKSLLSLHKAELRQEEGKASAAQKREAELARELAQWQERCKSIAEDKLNLLEKVKGLELDLENLNQQVSRESGSAPALKAEVERLNRYLCGVEPGEVNPPGTADLLRQWRECAGKLSEFAPKQGKSYLEYERLLAEEAV